MATDQPIEVTADRAPFAMVPYWMLDASAPALRLYVLLARYADNATRVAWPSRATLAKDLGYSRAASVDPLIAELEEMGAVTVIRSRSENGVNNPNRYRVNMDQRMVRKTAPPDPGGVVRKNRRGSTENLQGVVRKTVPELRTTNYNQELEPAPALFEAPAGTDLVKANPARDIAQKLHEGTKGGWPFKASYGIVKWALDAGYGQEQILTATRNLFMARRPLTKSSLMYELQGAPNRVATSTKLAQDHSALINSYKEQEAKEEQYEEV